MPPTSVTMQAVYFVSPLPALLFSSGASPHATAAPNTSPPVATTEAIRIPRTERKTSPFPLHTAPEAVAALGEDLRLAAGLPRYGREAYARVHPPADNRARLLNPCYRYVTLGWDKSLTGSVIGRSTLASPAGPHRLRVTARRPPPPR
ncbi:hypothetical protein GCM10012279_06650 [Micromonospora yangpuensis]|nr:hypothetical protein GCM10012279_06650 [Micromonospora yangpuensis]